MENKEERSWFENLRQTYRLGVMNSETFEEVGSYKLSLLNLYIILSGIAVAVAILVIAIIVLTPVKRYIPGYGDVKQQAELIQLNQEIDELEQSLKSHEAYTDNFRRMLIGEPTEETPLEEGIDEEMPDSLLNVERIREDELLRKEIANDELLHEQELLSKTANFTPREMPLEQMYFIPPVTGVISESYAIDKKHLGVDVMAPKNTPVKAALDGYVFASDWTLETGNTIGIQHANNIITFYKHNSALLKKAGDSVKAGEAVAIIGNSGTLSNGPHLHFEIWHRGKHVNPEDFINFN